MRVFHFTCFDPEQLLSCCTEREGGVSDAPYTGLNLGFHVGDDPARVLANRSRVAAELELELAAFVVPRQVHGGNVERVGASDRGRGAFSHDDAVPDTDALITGDAGVALAVLLADCVPVVIHDPQAPAVGVAHAGWGGTVHHIARRTVEAMARELDADPARMIAAIGPSIGPASYEVGPDVAERASGEFPHTTVVRAKGNGKYLFDLWASNVADLVEAGVPPAQVSLAEIDTFENSERFFSARRQQPTGRFMALAMLR